MYRDHLLTKTYLRTCLMAVTVRADARNRKSVKISILFKMLKLIY